MNKFLKTVPKSLLLSIFLSSCSPALVVTKVERQLPEKKYLRDCGSPVFDKQQAVYSDLIPYIKRLQSALALCNNDKEALRAWSALQD